MLMNQFEPEIATEGENVLPTYHEKIKIFQGVSPNLLAMEAGLRQQFGESEWLWRSDHLEPL